MGTTKKEPIGNAARSFRWRRRNAKKAWASSIAYAIRKRAKEAGIPCEIDAAYLISITPERCPVFDTAFIFLGNKKILPTSPSVDRLNPALGYVPGNVVVISMKANSIKSAYGSKDLFKVADWLWEYGL